MDFVLLTFANSQKSPLPSLQEEGDEVFKILVNRQLKGHFSIDRDQYVTLDKLNDALDRYNENLVLFLYSGHAGPDNLSFDKDEANAKGLSYQLGRIAKKGKLKLVILNGCSTASQVESLLDAGVPVVVATNAPVNDKSATKFSIHFFRCLSEKRMSIKDSFAEALGPAQTATRRDLNIDDIIKVDRGIIIEKDKEEPVWGLFSLNKESLDSNPLPVQKSQGKKSNFVPNERLTSELFSTLSEAGCIDIEMLKIKEERGDYVEIGDKQTTIVNVLPFPIAIHLQKVLCPVENANEGFDKISLARLNEIGTLFHTSVELMGIVMLTQLWELKLKNKIDSLPSEFMKVLQHYFHLTSAERAIFDYLAFIKSIRIFLESVWDKKETLYFVEELDDLKKLLEEGGDFSNACNYLYQLRHQTVSGKIEESDIHDLCQEAEDNLCLFFRHLGFMHRYSLTSIQDIQIQNFRHQPSPIFKHNVVKLMRAIGKPEQSHYLLSDFFDNRGVVLLKGKVKLVDKQKKEFTSDDLEFLNLSPFIIDRNAFEKNTDLSNLMFFDNFLSESKIYVYKNVKRPDKKSDCLEIDTDKFHGVHLQMEAFRTTVLKEPTS